MVDLIHKKREGEILSDAEINWLIAGFVADEIPAYQISALMMAIFFQGMVSTETSALVKAMIASGDTIDLSGIHGIKVDKHSTGGVGDKTSIVLGPMVAAAGVPVGKLSGRGLGHTGGTLDKLESFDGFRIELSMEEFVRNVNGIGIAIAGQTAKLVPADKQLYALRDVTATVENVSLIASSIMSKKIASGCDAIVLDVKTGAGAFMETPEEARVLAREMVNIGNELGRKTVAFVTDMEQPLGRTVGNALEVKEAIATLKGEGPEDLHQLCLALGAEMLVLGGKAKSGEEARAILEKGIQSGAALDKLRELVEAQGGDVNQVDNPDLLPGAKHVQVLKASEDGFVQGLDAGMVGMASMLLGAGRETKESVIDMGAGIELRVKRGQKVDKGMPLATLYTNSAGRMDEAMEMLRSAYQIGATEPEKRPLIFGRIS
jgi:pyrimidine-nucleoside phosphorylase